MNALSNARIARQFSNGVTIYSNILRMSTQKKILEINSLKKAQKRNFSSLLPLNVQLTQRKHYWATEKGNCLPTRALGHSNVPYVRWIFQEGVNCFFIKKSM